MPVWIHMAFAGGGADYGRGGACFFGLPWPCCGPCSSSGGEVVGFQALEVQRLGLGFRTS